MAGERNRRVFLYELLEANGVKCAGSYDAYTGLQQLYGGPLSPVDVASK